MSKTLKGVLHTPLKNKKQIFSRQNHVLRRNEVTFESGGIHLKIDYFKLGISLKTPCKCHM